jgi:hypothetical protein
VTDAVPARITNPKVATLTPTWRRFRGTSVLFDNPGTRLAPGVTPLEDLPVDEPDRQRLYDDLAGVVAQVDAEAMRERYGFCPLPRYSYHVTICDGPNERTISGDGAPQHAAAALIEQLPDSLDRAPTTLGCLCRARVLRVVADSPITFAATGVAIWSHVLAALLEPAGALSRSALDRVTQARAELVDDLRTQLGLQISAWRPHVSLGYFPNRAAAKAATATLARWNRALTTWPPSPITFDSASVYGFTDMVSFLRLGL